MASGNTKIAQLYRMVMPEHICPYGLKALHLLRHEGFHVEDHHLKTRAETDAFKAQHDVRTTPQTFIEGQRVGGYDDLRRGFGQHVAAKDAVTYRPVVALFAMAALMALAVSQYSQRALLSIATLESFIAMAMCLLA